MIIGGKRREEVIPRSVFKYKTVLIVTPATWAAYIFTTKAAARKWVREICDAQEAHGTDWIVQVDLTGHQTVDQCEHWARTELRLARVSSARQQADLPTEWRFPGSTLASEGWHYKIYPKGHTLSMFGL